MSDQIHDRFASAIFFALSDTGAFRPIITSELAAAYYVNKFLKTYIPFKQTKQQQLVKSLEIIF